MYDLPKLDLKRTQQKIEEFIGNYDRVVLGVSGGLDSACVATLSVNALGKDNVKGILMPDGDHDMKDAFDVVKKLDIEYNVKPIGPVLNGYAEMLGMENEDRVALANIKARTRMTTLYYHANKEKRIVAGTGDRSEILVGYFTKYGDGGVDILPIGNLYKTQVRNLSREIGVPEKIIQKPSSPDLWKGQTAEGELGMSYEELDKILYNLVDRDLKIGEVDYDRNKVEYVKGLIDKNAHKCAMPPVAEVAYYE